mmetsp:Transcript_7327/g.14928  ORF Transcript_7327/g.14928 Transcript_7327/m.14928 type:complete len:384 (-) Transcript_7327:355-1506(-)
MQADLCSARAAIEHVARTDSKASGSAGGAGQADDDKSCVDESLLQRRKRLKAAHKLADPLEDPHNVEAVFFLRRLQQKWRYETERKTLLKNMNEVLTKGQYSYENPFGADDIENFLNVFMELTKSEQTAFFAACQTCVRERRHLCDEDIRTILRVPVKPPFFVSPSRGRDDTGTGSERRPFKTEDRACEFVNAYLGRFGQLDDKWETPMVAVKCKSPHCEFLPCPHSGCKTLVCLKHGAPGDGAPGEGIWNGDAFACDSLEFCVIQCMVEGCKAVRCEKHMRDMEICDVCTNRQMAEVSLGCYDHGDCGIGQYWVCREHAVRCEGRPVGSEHSNNAEEWYGHDGDGAEQAGLEGTVEREVCGFMCCPTCLDEHECGDNPVDYC